jgi:hypothetical protein
MSGPFLRVNRGLSPRWFVHRWHTDQDFHAWHGQRARAGATISIGWWRIQVALLGRCDHRAARDLLTAADRLRDRWAEGDDAVKQQLWRDLHTKADELREVLQ